ncbi:hypothetical protein pipiens_015869 [Culex pipiens pipiens]|uniref:Uncharacterized protein n=1 Tax=Culex pipiens pipiens TaxID=38569 RepID=A0ABD1CNN1_CULPP
MIHVYLVFQAVLSRHAERREVPYWTVPCDAFCPGPERAASPIEDRCGVVCGVVDRILENFNMCAEQVVDSCVCHKVAAFPNSEFPRLLNIGEDSVSLISQPPPSFGVRVEREHT